MTTVGVELDRIQSRLHDAGELWTRDELARWWNDGYRELMAQSGALRRPRLLDMPGRHTYALTFEWEDRHTTGTVRKPSRTVGAGGFQATMVWEAEHLGFLTPTAASLSGLTYEWERSFVPSTDRHYRFVFPKNHERVTRITWNDLRLSPVAVRELDETDTSWEGRIGMPRWWTTGVGRITSVEVYNISTLYTQAWALVTPDAGIPRSWSGARTYTPEVHPDRVPNAYAYTSGGDADELTRPAMPFAPVYAYCYTWELTYAPSPSYNFTVNLAMNYPALQYVAVHAWEIGQVFGNVAPSPDPALPGMRGMFPWERFSSSRSYESLVLTPDVPPVLTGPGASLTLAATNPANGYGVQLWEVDLLNGAATLRAGGTIGCYTWEERYGATLVLVCVGAVRQAVSPDRQYFPLAAEPGVDPFLGSARDWRSSDDAIMVHEVIVPGVTLAESDVPALIPIPLMKYVRYYVLSRAFGWGAEGRQPILADHFERRFLRGVALMQRFADIAHRDRVYRREEETAKPDRVIARVRLPAAFPSVFE